MTLQDIEQLARARALAIRGAFHPAAEDGAPEGTATLILLGPDEPRFWPVFTRTSEYLDGTPDPLDRWSQRVIGALAQDLGGHALFPFGGPPYQPFLRWAERSGRAWPSPVGPLVHDSAGMMISYRGAVALPARLELPDGPDRPCSGCVGQPCTTACPVGALSADRPYDVAACRAYVASDAGRACRSGCLVRRACPVSARLGRDPAQSAFHMSAFLPE